MKKNRSMKIGTKITVSVLAISAAILVGAFGYIISTMSARNTETVSADQAMLSSKNAAIAKGILDEPMQAARTLAGALQGYAQIDEAARRAYYNEIMKEIIRNNKKILGVWTVWEPNALDGKDADYAGKDGYDTSGRFVPYWVWNGDQVEYAACVDYDKPGAGDYYLLARDTGEETVLEPYEYEVGGKKVLLTTFAVPIKDAGGAIVGVAGVDMTLEALQGAAFDKGSFPSSHNMLVSNGGIVVIHPDASHVNETLGDIFVKDNAGKALQAIAKGEKISFDDVSLLDGQPSCVTFSPIVIGGTKTPWATALIDEYRDINAMTSETTTMLVIVLLALLALMAGALAFLINRIVSLPIRKTVRLAADLASGKLDSAIAIQSMDEVGQLQRTLDTDVRQAFRNIQRAQQVSEKQSAYQEAEVKKLMISLEKLSAGDTNCMSGVAAADADTEALRTVFAAINGSLAACIGAIQRLVDDSGMLVEAAIEGRLSTRADATRHSGSFRQIVDGVNRTLDAVIEPVKEASAVLSEMSRGNLGVTVAGDYQGDHAAIKHALNDTITTVRGYIREITEVLTRIAENDLDTGITTDYRGEFTAIKDSINSIVESLNGVISDIGRAAGQVASGTQQVSAGAQQLSQGATEQASAIEELTGSLSEIAGQTRQNAVDAGHASELAVTAREEAEAGNARMNDLQQAMKDINDASANISKIIKVIDDIAFQTNLLALNAAVEAARAGQHGKGFAVVAEEVRNLAQRSASAARETTAMIEESIRKVKDGTTIANDTAQALNRIVAGVQKATELVGGIATASNGQATAVAQVNTGIGQVSQVVQTNSATAEESAAASEELSSQAALLKEMVGRFALKETMHARTAEPGRAQPENPAKALPGGKHSARPTIALNDREFGKY